MFKTFALIFGFFFTALGILGFIPQLKPDDLLFTILKVDLQINCIHLLTGVIAFSTFFVQRYFQRIYFQVVGFIYATLAVLGFIYGETQILGFIGNNQVESWFHVIVAVSSMILGFGTNNVLERTNERN